MENVDGSARLQCTKNDGVSHLSEVTSGEAEPACVDRCSTCGATIDSDGLRITHVVRVDSLVSETHYCSDDCVPDEVPERSPDRPDEPQDWSYCR